MDDRWVSERDLYCRLIIEDAGGPGYPSGRVRLTTCEHGRSTYIPLGPDEACRVALELLRRSGKMTTQILSLIADRLHAEHRPVDPRG